MPGRALLWKCNAEAVIGPFIHHVAPSHYHSICGLHQGEIALDEALDQHKSVFTCHVLFYIAELPLTVYNCNTVMRPSRHGCAILENAVRIFKPKPSAMDRIMRVIPPFLSH